VLEGHRTQSKSISTRCGDARRAIVKQFPYVVFYRIEAKAIYVYAAFHTSQNPQRWMDRLAH
jgi:plasmid stabilization system protein ParE